MCEREPVQVHCQCDRKECTSVKGLCGSVCLLICFEAYRGGIQIHTRVALSGGEEAQLKHPTSFTNFAPPFIPSISKL